MGFAEEVRTRWLSANLITTTNFFKGPKAVIPSGPNAGPGPFVLFTLSPGQANELTQDNVLGYEKPSAQIIVIADIPSVAESTAKALRTNIMSVRNTDLSGTNYREIKADQPVYDLPLDAAERPRSAFNISAIKRPS